MSVLADAQIDAVEGLTAERLSHRGDPYLLPLHQGAPEGLVEARFQKGIDVALPLEAFVDEVERDAIKQFGEGEQRLDHGGGAASTGQGDVQQPLLLSPEGGQVFADQGDERLI